jgi:hypothetical protein
VSSAYNDYIILFKHDILGYVPRETPGRLAA